MSPFGGGALDPLEEQAVEECQRAEWIDRRKGGLSRFVWRAHVLPVGLPLGLALAALDALAGGTRGDYASGAMLAEGWLCVAAAMGAAHVSALLEWQRRERIHHERYGSAKTSGAPPR
jgi:hypothetical protein